MRRENRRSARDAGAVQARRHRADQPARPGITRMLATAVPGLAPILARELHGLPGATVQDSGFDGRSDIVLFDASRDARSAALDLGVAEDVFVEVGRTLRADGDNPAWISGRIWRPERVQRALSLWADLVRPLSGSMTFRVIARVLQERSFVRTELRRQLTETIRRDRPRWRVADPAQIEVWISEYTQGRFVAGLRLSGAGMRQHDGRLVEREGALRPTVARAMVTLAGPPAGGTLLDPCCGAGTILSEAVIVGWRAKGIDIDSDAVEIARKNTPTAEVHAGDVRSLDLPEASVAATVTNLPFGRQYAVQGDMRSWLRTSLGEIARVTRPSGRVVLLAPDIPAPAAPKQLRPVERFPIRLLGTKTTIWVYDRT